jgi:hypothetical protein
MRHATFLLAAAGLAGLCSVAEASTHAMKISGFVANGNTCEAMVTRNPAVIPDVTNVNIKIGGPIGMAPPDPGFWHIDSPTVVMALAGTGVHVTDFVHNVEYDESNTAVHNGPFVSGTWTVSLLNNMGTACSDYDNAVVVTFTVTP